MKKAAGPPVKGGVPPQESYDQKVNRLLAGPKDVIKDEIVKLTQKADALKKSKAGMENLLGMYSGNNPNAGPVQKQINDIDVEIGQINNAVDRLNAAVGGPVQKKYSILYDFAGSDGTQLTVKVGETVVRLEGGDEFWYYCELNGSTGYVPKDYLKEIVVQPSPQTQAPVRVPPPPPTSSNSNTSSPQLPSYQQVQQQQQQNPYSNAPTLGSSGSSGSGIRESVGAFKKTTGPPAPKRPESQYQSQPQQQPQSQVNNDYYSSPPPPPPEDDSSGGGPPPPPPPAPMVKVNNSGGGGGAGRGALLSSINGFKSGGLKKVQTNDRSKPSLVPDKSKTGGGGGGGGGGMMADILAKRNNMRSSSTISDTPKSPPSTNPNIPMKQNTTPPVKTLNTSMSSPRANSGTVSSSGSPSLMSSKSLTSINVKSTSPSTPPIKNTANTATVSSGPPIPSRDTRESIRQNYNTAPYNPSTSTSSSTLSSSSSSLKNSSGGGDQSNQELKEEIMRELRAEFQSELKSLRDEIEYLKQQLNNQYQY